MNHRLMKSNPDQSSDIPPIALAIHERGEVVAVADCLVWVKGLPKARLGDVLVTEDGSRALAYQLDERLIGAILLEQSSSLAAGARIWSSGKTLSVAVGDSLLGRVLDPLGRPLDGLPPPVTTTTRPVESRSPSIMARDFVKKPLHTGTTIVDTLLPIGRGQRQLIIGDTGTGKSSIAIDAVIHQKDVRCIYVLIGQRRSAVTETILHLQKTGAIAHTVVVVAEASSLPGIQYLAPYSGCAIAEAWMASGHDTLIVYDDLGQHALAYRELSLLFRRPPGREAYPGDIFYLHARLLERATQLSPQRGGGSMTALPIVPTEQGELSSYIPTNLISITDGQIYLNQNLFSAGMRPAIDIGRSVSRIGGKAQNKAVAKESGSLRLDYLQFLELEMFTRFGTRLEAGMAAKVSQGKQLQLLFSQERLVPRPIQYQMAWLVAWNEGWLAEMDPDKLKVLLERLLELSVTNALPSMEADRERWRMAVAGWLEQPL
ncbi:MAG: F0F1 ATP synthase subunit alpha [Pseudomonadales bacterium]|nr:F0F1 ATP synthase subunit alpha [Pseudomonadales bacterium]